MNQHSSGIM